MGGFIMNKVFGLILGVLLLTGIGYGTYDFYQDCYGPDRGVVVEYVVQRGDTPIGISNKFASDRYEELKDIGENVTLVAE